MKYSGKFGFNKLAHWITYLYIPTKCLHVESNENSFVTDLCYTNPKEELFRGGWETLYAYDRRFTGGVSRDGFVREFLTYPTAHSLVARNRSTGKIVGIGALREACSGNLTVGPLYAESKEVAITLLRRLLSTHPLASIQSYPKLLMLFPSSNSDGVERLARGVCRPGQSADSGESLVWKKDTVRIQFTESVMQVSIEWQALIAL